MNGRLYDPELGRMLSPDPYVQVPEYSQNFNRYSYVLNNPLNLTDPTGFNWFGKACSWLKTNWRTVVVIVVAAILVCTGIGSTIALGIYGALGGTAVAATSLAGYVITGAFIGAVTGGLGAALNGGNMGDVLRGAVIGGISGALTGSLHGSSMFVNIAGHGIVGGASNVAMGGKFGDGFLSAAASAAAAQSGLASPDAGTIGADLGIACRTAIASIAGGTGSVLGGGKFANGAVTGAMTHLLNAEAEYSFGDYLHDVGDVCLGYGDALLGTVTAPYHAITSPVQTAKGLYNVASNPIAACNAVVDSISEMSNTNRGIGNIVGNVLIAVGTAGAGLAGESAVAARGVSGAEGLIEAGSVLDRGGLTMAGRALDKHGNRLGTIFPKAAGSVAAKNTQGQAVLDEIIRSNQQFIKPNSYGGRDIFDLNTLRGVRYDGNKNMIGFLAP
jgi:hypothetical protein